MRKRISGDLMPTIVNPHWEMITPGCRQALDVLRDQPFIRSFYLAGGTALALQIGHRVSILARALAYFDDAEQQPMPELTRRIKWAEVKRYAEAGARYLVEQQRAQARRAGL